MRRSRRAAGERGVTVIEAIVVLAVLALVAAVIATVVSSVRGRAEPSAGPAIVRAVPGNAG